MRHTTISPTITSLVAMECITSDGTMVPLEATFEFDPNDPYAVSVAFETSIPVRWTFGRDLLLAGFYAPVGDGDVHVFPCLSSTGSAVVVLDLVSPHGEALIQAESATLSAFILRMLTAVPVGAEAALIDYDSELASLLAPTGKRASRT